MNAKQSKWMIGLSAVVLMALSAGPALALLPDEERQIRHDLSARHS
jgi:hypothetical protein